MLSNLIKSFCVSFTTTVLADTITKSIKQGIKERKEKDERLEELEEFKRANQDLILVSRNGVLCDIKPYDTFMMFNPWANGENMKRMFAERRTIKDPVHEEKYRQIDRESLIASRAVLLCKLGMNAWELRKAINEIEKVKEARLELPIEIAIKLLEEENKLREGLAKKILETHFSIDGIWVADKAQKAFYEGALKELMEI